MKKMWKLGVAVCAMGMLAGCQTAQEVNDAHAQFEKGLPPAEAIVSGDKAVDAVGVSSANVYKQTTTMLKDYLAATNKDYRNFCGAVAQEMEAQKSSEAVASKVVKDKYMATEEGKKEWVQVELGIKAVQALNPTQKLLEITPLLASSAENAKNASQLKDSFKGFDANTLTKVNATKKIIDQSNSSTKALYFLQRFYSMNQAIPRSE